MSACPDVRHTNPAHQSTHGACFVPCVFSVKVRERLSRECADTMFHIASTKSTIKSMTAQHEVSSREDSPGEAHNPKEHPQVSTVLGSYVSFS